MSEVLGAIITGGCTITSAAIGFFASRAVTKEKMKSSMVHVVKPNESLFSEVCTADKVCLYTVNSYKWANIFQNELSKDQSAFVKEVVVLVRKKDDESPEYLKNLEEIITIWKKLRDQGRIRNLKIYSYKNDPDHYYVKIGNTHVITGHVYTDDSNVSGTSVDLQPIIISSNMKDGKEMLEHYDRHFEDMLKKNEQNVEYIA